MRISEKDIQARGDAMGTETGRDSLTARATPAVPSVREIDAQIAALRERRQAVLDAQAAISPEEYMRLPWTHAAGLLKSAAGHAVAIVTTPEGPSHDLSTYATQRLVTKLIHCAVNNHKALLDALTNLERAIDGFSRGEDAYVRDHGLGLTLARAEARAAIATAEGR